MKNLIIGTRGSRLALWQAEFVRAQLKEKHPQISVELEIIKTFGDRQQNVSLTEIGGQGVFVKELETALLGKRIDLAVHSLKDLPTVLPDNLHIAAVLKREDARDALIVRKDLKANSISELPENAVIGTSSLRRASQIKSLRPDLTIKDLRGNVDTRIEKLDVGDYDAIILAAAGLKRLGFENRIVAFLSFDEMLPQVGQGALAIETRQDDSETNDLVSVLNDAETCACVEAERAFLRGLGGGCQFPIAAHAWIEENQMRLEGLVAKPDGSEILRDAQIADFAKAKENGEALALRLLANGAQNLINIQK
ncbi:MAG: hydroxymethylbilane synthase [Acidobacteriota bacterium]|nr:hydroxymethylbilane synthase [Acidobacteriota bacterium]